MLVLPYDQTEESAIASCKSAAGAPPEPRNCARLQRRIVAAPWEQPGGRFVRFVHLETPIIITSSVWTKDSPWTDKVRNNIISLSSLFSLTFSLIEIVWAPGKWVGISIFPQLSVYSSFSFCKWSNWLEWSLVIAFCKRTAARRLMIFTLVLNSI